MRPTARALFVPLFFGLLLPLLLPDASLAALTRDERRAIKKTFKAADVPTKC